MERKFELSIEIDDFKVEAYRLGPGAKRQGAEYVVRSGRWNNSYWETVEVHSRHSELGAFALAQELMGKEIRRRKGE